MNGRVWTYVIEKPLSTEQLGLLKQKGDAFVKGWTAHDLQLHASFDILHDRIIIVKVNENVQEASGCSIDKLTRFISGVGAEFGVDLMNRLNVAYRDRGGVAIAPLAAVREKLRAGELTAETMVLDTTVSNDRELQEMEKPLGRSWLAKFLGN
jgi:hypothetical protein